VDWVGVLMVRVNVKKDACTRDAQQADIDLFKMVHNDRGSDEFITVLKTMYSRSHPRNVVGSVDGFLSGRDGSRQEKAPRLQGSPQLFQKGDEVFLREPNTYTGVRMIEPDDRTCNYACTSKTSSCGNTIITTWT
jgi:hypothetical protein